MASVFQPGVFQPVVFQQEQAARTTAARYLPWVRRKPREPAEPRDETEALLLCGAI